VSVHPRRIRGVSTLEFEDAQNLAGLLANGTFTKMAPAATAAYLMATRSEDTVHLHLTANNTLGKSKKSMRHLAVFSESCNQISHLLTASSRVATDRSLDSRIWMGSISPSCSVNSNLNPADRRVCRVFGARLGSLVSITDKFFRTR
jgi:hypothetical protein